eukprot:TRINITY_DN19367_c0_g1_i1.p1 TRINITY_DN19367_c0_g1~~TRINITY_DN19367_c0_g1_i1.p1  ORF type:complete len:162 (+),score=24.96 TRINITY_DN19367_c0_g1_i1:64-486(+)
MASSSAVPPWRQPKPSEKKDKYKHLNMKAIKEPGQPSVMYAPPSRRKGDQQATKEADDTLFDFDPELKVAFQTNFRFLRRALSLDTALKPLPAPLAQSLAKNLGFFTRIFTQFFDTKGIQNVRKTIGIGAEDVRTNVSET